MAASRPSLEIGGIGTGATWVTENPRSRRLRVARCAAGFSACASSGWAALLAPHADAFRPRPLDAGPYQCARAGDGRWVSRSCGYQARRLGQPSRFPHH